MIETEVHQLPNERKMAIIAKFDMSSIVMANMADEVIREIAIQIASRYVAENFQEIVKLMSPEAIANLSVAEAAAKIRETLEKKIPDKVLVVEKESRSVYQRGIFGGMKRVL